MIPRLLRPREAAHHLGMTFAEFKAARRTENPPPYYRLSAKTHRFSADELDDWQRQADLYGLRPPDSGIDPDIAETIARRQTVLALLDALPDRERKIVELRYGFHDETPRSLEEIGSDLGMTRERVQHALMSAIRRMSAYVDQEPGPRFDHDPPSIIGPQVYVTSGPKDEADYERIMALIHGQPPGWKLNMPLTYGVARAPSDRSGYTPTTTDEASSATD